MARNLVSGPILAQMTQIRAVNFVFFQKSGIVSH